MMIKSNLEMFIKLHYQAIALIAMCGVVGGAARQAHVNAEPKYHQPVTLLEHQHEIKHALNVIGNKDEDKASAVYNRKTHVLTFYVMYMNDVKKFTGKNAKQQRDEFERIANLNSVKVRLSLTKAKERQKIEKDEDRDQKKQNAIYAEQDKEAAAKQAAAQKKAAAEAKKQQAAQNKAAKKAAQSHKSKAKPKPKKTNKPRPKKRGGKR